MQQDKVTVTENRTQYTIPQFDAIDIITLVSVVILGMLLMTDRPVPEFLIAIIGIGTGAKVYTENQMNRVRDKSDKSDLG